MNDNHFKAAILDMDGVITQTAQLHARAWKRMFDEFLMAHGQQTASEQQRFDIDRDYRRYVDGKPRYDGVRSFLDARGIKLPEGNPDDPPREQTVYGLGNRKNQIFLEILEADGVKVWDDAVEQIESWKRDGWKVAVFSSSRNCQHVLQAAGLLDLFDARVDGKDLQKLGLRGKPSPDMLLCAAKQLGVKPTQAIAVEDAIAGVQAAFAGGFGLIVGIARGRNPEKLKQAGADRVVDDLRHWNAPRETALDELGRITRRLEGKRLALFLDYDGTLTPIVRRPEDATLSDAMRGLLSRLAEQYKVAIVSGRDRLDVQQMVGLDELIYAGSHGFDIRGPDGLRMQHDDAAKALPELDAAEDELRRRIENIEGAHIERKKFAIAAHYREVQGDDDVLEVEQAVDDVLRKHESLRKRSGKKIFELQPDISWDKGRAVLWLTEALGLSKREYVIIYIGDDVTDEDAFATLRCHDLGIGIRVAETPTETDAHYEVDNCAQGQRLLESLATSQIAVTK